MSHHCLILPKPIRGYFKVRFPFYFAKLISVQYVLTKDNNGYSKIFFTKQNLNF